MLSQKSSRWISAFIMLILAFRLGARFYRSQQPPESEAQLRDIKARVQELADSIEADQGEQQGRGARVVLADSSVLAADTAAAK
jgi:hypothetical protein